MVVHILHPFLFFVVLRVFVAFSSLDLRRGNTDKMYRSIYSSVIDRICEQRKLDGLPALAVHWGPIGEVKFEYFGLV